ncbi:MAG TPA: hypothetical protein VGQ72_00415 [Pyrinomonadaceae bacterium]|jgi:hypothetical protein|nr:hypothetical protein [Pyrinomonadaceae bacterium]
MNKVGSCTVAFIIVLLSVCNLRAQADKAPQVTKVFAALVTPIDTRTSVRDEEVTLTTINDVVVNSKVIIPKGAKIVGHVAGVLSKGKDEPKSVLAIAIDRAIGNGSDIPLQAIIVAIAAPQKSLTDGPTYGMMHSNEPKMSGSTTSGVTSSGTLPASSKASSTATVATAQLKSAQDQPFLLNDDSQGAIGYEDVAISWHLTIPPPLTIFATRGKRLRLEAGSQVLLRMVPPKISN